MQESNNQAENTQEQIGSTNSTIGSYHWYHTLVGRQKHIGEFLKNNTPTEDQLREWGKRLFDSSQELIDGYERINRV